MTTRTRETIVTFARPFLLKGVDRLLPAGAYRVVTDEELIEGLSFPVYHRVSTMIFVPASAHGSVEMIVIDPLDLNAAQARDASSEKGQVATDKTIEPVRGAEPAPSEIEREHPRRVPASFATPQVCEHFPMPSVDLNEIFFQCPSCGHDLKQSIGLLKQSRHMICPGCDIGINIDTDRLAMASEEIQKALDKVPPEITIKFFR